MIFLCSDISCTLTVFGTRILLEPIAYPNVNLKHILVAENDLGHLILRSNRHIKKIEFDYNKLPGFPSPLGRLDDVRGNQKIILLRGGGIGDLLMFAPVLKALKEGLSASTTITLATFTERHPLFREDPYIHQLAALPVRMHDFLTYDYYIDFCGKEDTFKDLHMTDYFLSYLSLAPGDNVVKEPRIDEALTHCPTILRKFEALRSRHHLPIVFFNAGASNIIRALPPVILDVLSANFPDVLFVVPSSDQVELPPSGNICHLNTFESLDAYVTAIKCSDGVVSSDSSTYHIAAALNRPGLVFFASIGSNLRSLYYPTIIPLDAYYQGTTCTAPCGLNRVEFPDKQTLDQSDLKTGIGSGCPEAKIRDTRYSPCLMSYSKETICKNFTLLLSRIQQMEIPYGGQRFQLMP